MKGRSKSSGLDRAGNPPAERFPQVTPTEGRPGAANLKTLPINRFRQSRESRVSGDSKQQLGLADLMHVTHTNECPYTQYLINKGNWSGTTARTLEEALLVSKHVLESCPSKSSIGMTEDWNGRAFLLDTFVKKSSGFTENFPELKGENYGTIRCKNTD